MKTVTVTIGRNVGDEPMSQEAWNHFVYYTTKAVDAATRELWVKAPYRGEWDGIEEDAYVVVGPLIPDFADSDILGNLRTRLANLATHYHQDAIGLSVGESELVESFGVRQGAPGETS